MQERLQKILAQRGIASRRHAEQLILDGKVRVNGCVAALGQKADPDVDFVEVEEKAIGRSPRPSSVYLLLHKPLGVVSTCSDPQGRPTVLDLLSPQDRAAGLHPVGRLDTQTTGALLLTNDGALTFALTHPRHRVTKTYEVTVRGTPTAATLNRWRSGILLEGRLTLPAEVEVLAPPNALQNSTQLQVILQEGRNRQIRLVAKALGHPVLQLHRTRIGPIALVDTYGCILSPGQYRSLTLSEIDALRPIIKIEARAARQKETIL
ncbi:pseudouridine synthase [Altericista sp. CCNU0014]|uniref:pseudouridine synthase n=1 Tax=Altericista sp. CCNU0014 TaxID=3082949 RepID=UPI00384B2241